MQEYTDQLSQHAVRRENRIENGVPINVAAMEAFELVRAPLQAQIEPLGERMAALGKRVEAGSDKALQRTLKLIQSAMASGAAKPVPGD